MAILRFHPASGAATLALPLSPATSLLVTIMKAGSMIRHDCGGKAQCGTCRVSLGEPRAANPPRALELGRLGSLGLPLDGSVRLACQTFAFKDLEARGLVEAEQDPKGSAG
ncbi:MAG: 2Fe-2S iron-sulfur cluster-binding protein [Spirochaetota bacterium]